MLKFQLNWYDQTQDRRRGSYRFKGIYKREPFVCTSVTDRDKHVAAQADSWLPNQWTSLSRSPATGASVDGRINEIFVYWSNTQYDEYLIRTVDTDDLQGCR